MIIILERRHCYGYYHARKNVKQNDKNCTKSKVGDQDKSNACHVVAKGRAHYLKCNR